MLRLALPTIVVLVVQTMVGVAETYFVSFLGTDALAGVALAFPVVMLMQMMSNGGIGGGVSSAVARALGANRGADADALVWHAIILACVFGIVFSAAAILAGPFLYRAMGGEGSTLTAALTYSGVVFSGAIPIWITALLSSALRGAGNVKVPAFVILAGAIIVLPLSPAMIFGWGPFPRLGVAGGGAAVVIYYVLAALALVLYLRSPRSLLQLRISPLQGRVFKDILGVGFLSAIGTISGESRRLPSSPLRSAASAPMPLLATGSPRASSTSRSRCSSGSVRPSSPWSASTSAPSRWHAHAASPGSAPLLPLESPSSSGLPSRLSRRPGSVCSATEPQVLALGTLYLRNVAPFYGAIGLALVLYFASQGARRVLFPVLAGSVRMIIAAFIGWSAVAWLGASLATLFQIIALAAISYGILTAATMLGGWGRRPATPPLVQTGQAE